jgi:hypothetical protein
MVSSVSVFVFAALVVIATTNYTFDEWKVKFNPMWVDGDDHYRRFIF